MTVASWARAPRFFFVQRQGHAFLDLHCRVVLASAMDQVHHFSIRPFRTVGDVSYLSSLVQGTCESTWSVHVVAFCNYCPVVLRVFGVYLGEMAVGGGVNKNLMHNIKVAIANRNKHMIFMQKESIEHSVSFITFPR